jgi:hypothetical protein
MNLVLCLVLLGCLESQTMSNISKLLAEAESSRGLPTGLLSSVMQQETGGKQDYLNDPAKYHYAANKQGKRVAGHTGKVSTAFGPFGLLESTGAKPGYGVQPLKDKSLPEQVRFAADYLGARIKHAGDVAAGLAGYGEGPKYASSVLSRLGWKPEGKDVIPVAVAEQVSKQMAMPAAAVTGNAAVTTQAVNAPSLTAEVDTRLAQLKDLLNKKQPLTDVTKESKPAINSGGSHPWWDSFAKFSGFN